MVTHHSLRDGQYRAVALNSEGLLAVTDDKNKCVHLVSKEGVLVRSIGKGELGDGWLLSGAAFDLKGNVWVTEWDNNKVIKLSQDGRLLTAIPHVASKSDCFNHPAGLSVSPEGLIYICDCGNHRITVHDEEGKFLFLFGSKGCGPGCFSRPCDIAFGSDGLVYAIDVGNERVCVWSKDGIFMREFKTKYTPTCIAATSDNHLVITSYSSNTVTVYTAVGQLVREFGGTGSGLGRFNRPFGICADDNGLVYVVGWSNRVQLFAITRILG